METQTMTAPSRADRYAKRVALPTIMRQYGLGAIAAPQRTRWRLPGGVAEAKRQLWGGICEAVRQMGGEPAPMAEYAEVAEWLADNDGKGLLLYGGCGLGKTLLASYVLPALLMRLHGKVLHTVDAVELDRRLAECRGYFLLSIDDVGAECVSQFRSLAFGELLDLAEKRGGMVVATTNLTGDQLRERYGDRVFDRIVGNMRRVLLTGESFRKREGAA